MKAVDMRTIPRANLNSKPGSSLKETRRNFTWTERPCRQGDPPVDSFLIGGSDLVPPQRIECRGPDGGVDATARISGAWLRRLAERIHARGPSELYDFLFALTSYVDSVDCFLAFWDQEFDPPP
jgi:hypothetical protein